MKPYKIRYNFFLIFLILFSACSVFQWEKDVEQNGIRFVKIRHIEPSGTIIGKTEQNFQTDSFVVEKGWVHFYPNWSLKTFLTAEPLLVGTMSLPAKSWIFLDSIGIVSHCVLPQDQEIQGILCRGGGGVSGITTSFYRSGRLKSCYPSEDIRIDGIPCSSNIFVPVGLYENGLLRSCRLADPITRSGKTFGKGTRIAISPDGTISEIN